jgi:hypothetical protein
MKTLQFKITILLLFIGLITVNAQKLEKKYSEKFIVNKDVVVDINTRYTDIEIQTWDKNEVVIEAYIDVKDEADQKVIDDYLKNWSFEALGNKNTIKISSKSSGLIDIHSFNFDAPNYDIIISESVSDVLENLHFEMPEMPEMPDMPELPPMPSPFDFKAYKKDKSYLERWKKENKEFIGKNAKIKVGRNSILINTNDDGSSFEWNITTDGQKHLAKEIEERLEETKILREERHKEIQERMKERQEEMKERQVEAQNRVKEHSKERKLALIERQEAQKLRAKEFEKRRTEVRDILAKREKVKIKRIIKIKAPKDAKFNMNVKYGSMSFPK